MIKKLLKPDIIPGIVSGFINGIILIVIAMALSSIIFTGSLSPFLPQGIGIILFGFLFYAVFSFFTASYPININTPQDIPIAIIALIATNVMATFGKSWSPNEAFQFIFVTITFTSIMVGFFFFILGALKMGKLVRYIPYPVVGGFLAGTGWLIIKFAFIMTAEIEFSITNISLILNLSILLKWLPGFLFGISILIAGRFTSHYSLLPSFIVSGILIFYFIMFYNGYSFKYIESNGLLLGPFPDGGLYQGSALKYIASFEWNVFFAQLPAIGTMMILNSISILFNYSGLELIIKKDLDLDRELKVTGSGNILAGIFGGPPGHLALGGVSLAHSIGSKTKLSTVVVALMCGFALFFGSKVLSVFPRIILGGLLFYLGSSFIVDWIINTWKRVPKSDYLVILLIFFVIGSIGFLEGVIVGLLASVSLFVVNYSKVKTIKHRLTGKNFHSNVERSDRIKSVLEKFGNLVLILPLQGYLFFGSANRLLENVKEYLKSKKGSTLKFLLFDFKHVSGIDSSTVNSFNKMKILADLNRFKILFCNLPKNIMYQFKAEGLFNDTSNQTFKLFHDLDYAMEWCEDEIISSELQDFEENLSEAQLFESKFSDLLPYFETVIFEKKSKIIEEGVKSRGLFFIKSGRVTVQLNSNKNKKIRLKSMGPGTIVGEVSLYLNSLATASVISENKCEVYFLSHANFEKLKNESSNRAAELHTYVIRLLSDRLAKSNATIRALME